MSDGVRQRKSGKWEARLTVNGRRKSKYAATKKEAQVKYLALQNEAGLGYSETPSEMTVAEYLDRWLADTVRPNRRYKTVTSYERVVENHIKPHVGPLRLGKLVAAHLKGFRSALAARKGDDAVGKHTIWYACIILKAAMRSASGDGLIPVNPFADVRLEKPATKKMTPWTMVDAQRFFAHTEDKKDRLLAFYVLATATGLRHGELLGLRWEDINFDAGTISVRRSLEERTEGAFALGEVKTAKSEGTISVAKTALSALRAHKLRYGAAGKGEAAGFVFTTRNGTFYRQTNVRKSFKARAKAAGVTPITVHSLRHTCATLLLESGEDLKNIQALLRHADFSTTANTYAHVTAKAKALTAGRMDALFTEET